MSCELYLSFDSANLSPSLTKTSLNDNGSRKHLTQILRDQHVEHKKYSSISKWRTSGIKFIELAAAGGFL